MTDHPIYEDLWQEISRDPAKEGLVRRRILPALEHDIFVGELRPSGQRVLILQIEGQSAVLPRKRPSSRGLIVGSDSNDSGKVNIRLTSASTGADPLFTELAADVIAVLVQSPGDGAAARVLQRVMAWQTFFAARRETFGPERAAGLFSELAVLKTAFLPIVGPDSALIAWCGPDPAVQDFQHGVLAVEVKSFRGTGPGQLQISSERQLETSGVGRLYVAYLRLDQRRDGTGLTLGESIDELRNSLAHTPFAQDLLRQSLLNYGWHDSMRDSRDEKYEIKSAELFEVTYGFPRITSSDLPNGVGAVSYSIDRSSIETFQVSWETFTERLKEER